MINKNKEPIKKKSIDKKKVEKYYLYILLCCDGSYYIGTTLDIKKRFLAHASGHGAKYTRAKKVDSIIAAWILEGKNISLSVEAIIKNASKKDKIEFVKNTFLLKKFYKKNKGLNIKIRRVDKKIIEKINNTLVNNIYRASF